MEPQDAPLNISFFYVVSPWFALYAAFERYPSNPCVL